MEGVYHLVYTSEAVRALADHDLDRLVDDARVNNGITGITGLLLYQEGAFIQVLEGEESIVEGTFDLIRADPRHRNIRVMYRGHHPRREFEGWSMGFRQDRDLAFDQALAICSALQFRDPEDDVSRALRQLVEISDII